ncbi:MAG: division/cell wall cluster transcriptional repressor MraZ [Alphaproteobacteria bacterium]|nr:division/cell wall cluster transcriptional repressor MraZ [Alphaproteobacteria bacterium]
MFLSSYESGVDVKKRVSIPASFRKAMSGEESVFLWPSIDKACLEGGGTELVGKWRRAISRMNGPRRVAFANLILGRGRFYKFDDGGRIVLEDDFLDHTRITDKARFVGLGDSFEIWTPDVHQSRYDALLQLARETVDEVNPFEDGEGGPA